MRCHAVRNKLDLLLRHELASRMRQRVERHLRTCPDCREHLARQQRLARFLIAVPEPPTVPGGLVDDLVAEAFRRRSARGPVSASHWRKNWLPTTRAAGKPAARLAVLAGGILIGVVMAQQTMSSVTTSGARQSMQPGPVAEYELDRLTDVPASSLAEIFLTLTKDANHRGA